MHDQPDLSIIILNYKMGGLVKNCLKSIFDHDPQVSLEVFVVDNDSSDDCEELVTEHYPQVKFIQSGANIGHAKGNNLAIKEASGRYIMILNPDIVLLENVFDKIVEMLDREKDIGMTTVQLRSPDGSLQPGAWRFHELSTPLIQRNKFIRNTKWGQAANRKFEIKDWDRRDSQAVDWVQGSCLIARRETLDDIGLFDERFFLYFTDVDLCRRAWAAGWRVYYYSEVGAIHYYHRESAQHSGLRALTHKAARLHIKDWLRYLKKYWGVPKPR